MDPTSYIKRYGDEKYVRRTLAMAMNVPWLICLFICILNFSSLAEILEALFPSLPNEQILQVYYWSAFGISMTVILLRQQSVLYILSNSPVVLAIILLPLIYIVFADNISHAVVSTVRLYVLLTYVLAVIVLVPTRVMFSTLQLVTVVSAIADGYALFRNSTYTTVDFINRENILNYKNHIGVICALAGVCCLWSIYEKRRGFLSTCGLAIATFILFFMAKSATSILLLIVGIFVLSFFALIFSIKGSLEFKIFIPLSLILCAFAVVLIIDFDQLVEILGRDASLTGRTEIWALGYDLIVERPIFGYGYSILEDKQGPLSDLVSSVVESLPHLHNSWLNIALQFGMIGVILHSVAFVALVLRGLAIFRVDRRLGALVFSFVSMIIVYSFVESSFMMNRSELSYLIFFILCLPETRVSVKNDQLAVLRAVP